MGVYQKNSDPPTSLLTFNVGQICDIFSGKGKGESGAMLVVIMLVMLVSIIRVMLVVIIAGDL